MAKKEEAPQREEEYGSESVGPQISVPPLKHNMLSNSPQVTLPLTRQTAAPASPSGASLYQSISEWG